MEKSILFKCGFFENQTVAEGIRPEIMFCCDSFVDICGKTLNFRYFGPKPILGVRGAKWNLGGISKKMKKWIFTQLWTLISHDRVVIEEKMNYLINLWDVLYQKLSTNYISNKAITAVCGQNRWCIFRKFYFYCSSGPPKG